MITFATFYQLSTGYVPGTIPPKFDDSYKQPIEVCGDRSVIILDGRESASSHCSIAHDWAIKHGFVGYSIDKGQTIARGVVKGEYHSAK